MKCIYIKWHRGGQYERRGERKAAIKNAHRTVRQSCRKQLRAIQNRFDLSDYEIIPIEWYDGVIDNQTVQYFDDFMHPTVRLSEPFQ